MKKLTAVTLTTLAALCSLSTTLSVSARNPLKDSAAPQQHHSGSGNALLLGGYDTVCIRGQGTADSRNITNASGHNVQVVHMTGQGSSSSLAFLNNLDSVPTAVNSPISFSVVKGNARYLLITLQYIPHGGTFADNVALYLVSPDTKFVFPGLPLTSLISDGNGKYTIPFGENGIPQGAQLVYVSFNQFGDRADCSNHVFDVNEFQINHRFVGIAADPGASCGIACGAAAD